MMKVETPTESQTSQDQGRRSPVMLGTVVLLLAVVGLAVALVWVSSSDDSSYAAASPEVERVLEERNAAINRGDGEAAAALYAEDAVLEELEGAPWSAGDPPTYTFVGREEIQARLQDLSDTGLRLEAVGHPVQMAGEPEQVGILVAEPTRFLQAGGPGYGEGMLVFLIDADGLIAHQWMIGWVDSSS